MPRLSLSLFGPFKAALDGSPIAEFESNKVRALLAYLAVEADRPHRRETLAGLLWPERTDRAASANLRNALANLRKALRDRGANEVRDPFLLITRETIQFNRESDQSVDVATFRSLLQAGREPKSTDQALEQAIAVYRGSFLEGLQVRGSPAFDDWSLIVRERCQREMLSALQRLSERNEARGEYDRACDYAWRQVELEPWQEKSHRRLMRLLALGGQRGAALAQYKVCRRQLAEELGVEPARETRQLYERIRDGVETPASVSTPQHNLPAQLVPFCGRQGEVREITARLCDPSCRLLTLVGAGGSGKTRLALEAAARQVGAYEQGVFFVPLAPLRSAEGLAPTVAQALCFVFHTGSEPRQQLLDYLRNRNVLLILDNFEHLLSSPVDGTLRREGAEWVTELLNAAPHVKALVTSRARLNVRGETLLPIGGMDVPPLIAPDRTEDGSPPARRGEDAAQYSAVQLFVQCARRLRPGFAPVGNDLWNVAQICRQVAGMPLGVLLAASWTEMLSPAEISRQLRTQSIDFLQTNWRDVPERQQSMRAVFDHSWRLLSEREQALFAGLSVFRGSFTHHAAQRVTGASLLELISLVHKSLLQRTPAGRHEVHELLRQYAAAKLAALPDQGRAVRERHAATYTDALQQWERELKGPGQQEALAEMDVDVENARAAWEWAAAQRQTTYLSRSMDGLCRFYEWRTRLQEGRAACQLVAGAWTDAEGQVEPGDRLSGDTLRIRIRALAWQGVFDLIAGKAQTSWQAYTTSLHLLESADLMDRETRAVRAFILLRMGEARVGLSHEQAGRLVEQALALYRALDDRWSTAQALSCLGSLYLLTSKFNRARRLHKESLALRRSLGDRIGIAESLRALGNVDGNEGRLEEGERLVRQAVELYQEIGEDAAGADGIFLLASLFVWSGRFAEACPLFEQAAAIHKERGMRAKYAWDQQILAWSEMNLGLYRHSLDRLQAARLLFREHADRFGVGMALLGLSELSLIEQDYAEARRLSRESASVFGELGVKDHVGLALASLAHAEWGLGRSAQAHEHVRETLRLAIETQAFALAVTALLAASLLCLTQGKTERAVELCATAFAHPYVGNSQFRDDVAGRYVAAAAAPLPPDVVAAARERGATRDMWAAVDELLAEE